MKHDTSAHADHDHDNSAMHSGQRLASVPSGGGSNYTCPMHPEVISDKPGSWSKVWNDFGANDTHNPGQNDLHLSNASRGRTGSSRSMPEVRDNARPENGRG